MSITGKKRSSIGLGHDGAPKPGAFVPHDHPAAMGVHPHAIEASNIKAGMQDQTNVHADLGKPAKPKRALTTTPPIAGGMTAKSRSDGTHFHNIGGQDLSRYDSDPGKDPLRGPPRGKNLTPPAPSFGQRSRIDPTADMKALGAAVLAEAFAASAPDDRAAHGYGIGTLPDATNED